MRKAAKGFRWRYPDIELNFEFWVPKEVHNIVKGKRDPSVGLNNTDNLACKKSKLSRQRTCFGANLPLCANLYPVCILVAGELTDRAPRSGVRECCIGSCNNDVLHRFNIEDKPPQQSRLRSCQRPRGLMSIRHPLLVNGSCTQPERGLLFAFH